MYESMMDSFRKAAETTLQVQQDMFRTWAEYLNPAAVSHHHAGSAVADVTDQLAAARKRWQETITGMLDKHRAALDHQYREGIKAIEQAFKAADARDPEQFRKIVEELWKHGFECLGTLINAQTKDFQKAMEKWAETAGQAFKPAKN